MIQDTSSEPRAARMDLSALVALPVRLVIGWTYFSAFWRRVVLENKLDPDVSGYIGEKFNHFLPNALGIRPMIEYLVGHPDLLKYAMVGFSVTEAIVGLFLMVGLATRTMAFGVLILALGILLGSGWIGSTCLDEWQIGVLGVACGLMLMLTGGGAFSVDRLLMTKNPATAQSKWFRRLCSGELRVKPAVVVSGSAVVLVLTLATNQYFHGGLYGPLHNKSTQPAVTVSDASIADGTLRFTVFRTEGTDVYGSFLTGVAIVDEATGRTVFDVGGDQLAHAAGLHITNHYVAKVKPGAHAVVIPLGARAQLALPVPGVDVPAGGYTLRLTDIDGSTWTAKLGGAD